MIKEKNAVKMKKKKKITTILCYILLCSIAFSTIDYLRISNGHSPIFVIDTGDREETNEFARYYIGLFYTIRRVYYDTPLQPFEESKNIKMGIWFLPDVEVYSYSYN